MLRWGLFAWSQFIWMLHIILLVELIFCKKGKGGEFSWTTQASLVSIFDGVFLPEKSLLVKNCSTLRMMMCLGSGGWLCSSRRTLTEWMADSTLDFMFEYSIYCYQIETFLTSGGVHGLFVNSFFSCLFGWWIIFGWNLLDKTFSSKN